jgi:predicted thioesterase
MRHLAATPIGMTVRARAVLRETDGRRCLFDVEAWDEVEKIAEGRHERYLVPSLERFLARTATKAQRPG